MARTAWIFEDLVTSETYDLVVNPNEGGTPEYRKNITSQTTAAPDGRVVLFEGRDEPKRMTVSGTILTEDLYNQFVTWFNKRNIIKITDDLGREFECYIESFNPQRVRSVSHPWRHTYSMEIIIIEGY